MSKSAHALLSLGGVMLLAMFSATSAAGAGMEEFGPAGEHIGRSNDWPQGMEDVLRHPSRVYWQWVNGSERTYYDDDLPAINELLDLYSRVKLAEHPVVLLPEKRKAESFHGKSTPYLVEFQIPGALETNARFRDGTADLYPNAPRLIIAVDGKLAERLDELVIPSNVTLQTSAVDIGKAIELAHSENPDLRRRAIFVLGQARESTPEILAAFERAAADSDGSVQAAGEAARKRLTKSSSSIDPRLRERLREFVEKHTRRVQVTEPKNGK